MSELGDNSREKSPSAPKAAITAHREEAAEERRPALRPISYPMLMRTNYTIWVMKMRVALQSQRVWEPVLAPTTDYQMDRDALYAIYQAVPDNVMASPDGKNAEKEAWDAIRLSNMGHEHVRVANLQNRKWNFEGLTMLDGVSVDDFAGRVTTFVSGIRALGENLSELTVVRKFLQGSTTRYMQLVTSIEQCVDLGTLTVEDLVGQYKAYDEHIRMSFDDPKGGST